ncbi:Hypothetical_protein [Hexamita inflata]|uniref:Hypothetical_protein n=1 Tax=Hexamita inflata TaxID=28002 RepID=A0AA86NF93_9EUKA|nr:Hypothetical protein HINF_LOCUS5735 [Hexamita inflata]
MCFLSLVQQFPLQILREFQQVATHIQQVYPQAAVQISRTVPATQLELETFQVFKNIQLPQELLSLYSESNGFTFTADNIFQSVSANFSVPSIQELQLLTIDDEKYFLIQQLKFGRIFLHANSQVFIQPSFNQALRPISASLTVYVKTMKSLFFLTGIEAIFMNLNPNNEQREVLGVLDENANFVVEEIMGMGQNQLGRKFRGKVK